MQFTIPEEEPFEIPSEWWEAAGMSGFVSEAQCYEVNANPPYRVVPISEVAPLKRQLGLKGFSKDGFVEERMISILRAFCSKILLPPVEVKQILAERYRYEVYHGVHRYYASVAAGLSHLPVTIVDDVQSFLNEEAAGGAKTERLKKAQ